MSDKDFKFPRGGNILGRQRAAIAAGSNGPSSWADAAYKFLTGKTPYGPEIVQVPLTDDNDIIQTQLGTFIRWGDKMIPLQQRAPAEPTIAESVGYVQDPTNGQVYQFIAQRQNKNAVVDLASAVIPGKRIVKGGVRGAGQKWAPSTGKVPANIGQNFSYQQEY